MGMVEGTYPSIEELVRRVRESRDSAVARVKALESENARLRAEVERLKRWEPNQDRLEGVSLLPQGGEAGS